MKANELRIGNWLHDINFNQDFECKYTDIEYCVENNKEFNECNKPIPLTEEWLLKFGAIKKDNDFYHDRFKLTYRNDYKFWYVVGMEDHYITKVEFVDEWQNVYFVLNGEELKNE